MNKLKTISSAIIISLITFNAFAATSVDTQTSYRLNKVGVVSASDATSLNELELIVKEKAEKAGADFYRIKSIQGNNKLHGIADIYR
ncbi:membrane protein [Chania multitudinisentens RB-25]|uniref:Membrane protein n=1 Tax=Chania multitudinisentens RB-25 TaxID=1441930 RepID=W0LCK1_9GAMM|nr:YdgH/BhsA/McbA-like domain containing protein [Chania multitudinisentens]AHG20124.1 membrane protein [Chania multitudinisentens RB-25]